MAHTFNTELHTIAKKYSELINGNVTATTIEKAIVENPYYPSLLALSDTFSKYNILNSGYKIATEDLFKQNVDVPFVAFVSIPKVGSDFVLVTKITNETISYSHKTRKIITQTKEDFSQNYKGIIWFAESNENSGELDYNDKKKKERVLELKKYTLIISSLIIFSLVVFANIDSNFFIPFSILLLLKIIGTSTASLLLLYEIDKNNAFVKNLCGVGGKTNCDAVLSSSASKIAGISWAEIGFFYFAATIIGLLVPNLSFQIKSTWIAIANIFAFPYVFFSIYYQWRVIKQWCPLCLTVQFVLVSEFLWCFMNVWQNQLPDIFTPLSYFTIVFCILTPLVIWYSLKPVFIKFKNHDIYLSAYKRLQYNPDIFNNLLHQQSQAPDGWQNIGIEIGNKDAENIIIKVCNPYCDPCAKMHPKLEDILHTNKNTRVKIIFANSNNPKDKGSIVAKHLLAISQNGNNEDIEKALDSWYLSKIKDYDSFKKKYPMNGEIELQGTNLEKMSNWSNIAEITHTPTLFVNGYRLPENYTIDELKFIL